VKGSAKGRRSIAGRPKGAYGRLRATRPGEYVVLDTQDLDVYAMEPVTCRWTAVQLTVAQDLFTRCITAVRVTPSSTKAVDVAGLLYEAVVPRPVPESWPPEASWPYHGVPQHLAFTEDGQPAAMPSCPPETLVIDHGKAFLSTHVISVCTRLGISIQPSQPRKPTDNAYAERFVLTARTEVTDRMLIFGEHHLRTVLAQYARHYNGQRPHRSRQLRPPRPDHPVADLPSSGSIAVPCSADSSPNTSEPHRSPGQGPYPSSRTLQARERPEGRPPGQSGKGART